MRKLALIVVFAAGLAVSVLGLPAFADSGPASTSTQTSTTASTTTTTTTTSSTPTSTVTVTTPAPAVTTPNGHPPVHWFAGSVSSVGDGTLTVGVLWTGPNDGSLNGQTVTLAVSDHTRIFGPGHRAIALASIQQGQLVGVRAAGADLSSLTAVRIRVWCNCHWVGGTISSVGTSSFDVAVSRTGPYDTVLDNHEVTMQVNQYTVYLGGRRRFRLGLSDLKIGEGVGVVFSADGFFKAPGFDPTTATFTAKRVHVWGHRQVPPPSSDASSSAQVSTN
jgi:hypothetical protein